MIRSAQSTIRQISRLTKPTASPSKSLRPQLLLPVRTQATKSSDNNMSEYEQIMRMGIYHHHSSQSPRTSSSMSSRASKSTQSGSSSSSTTQQEAVSNAYRSVVEPTVYEDYDLWYEGNYHRPRMAAGGTTTTTYRYSNLNEGGGGEAGSVV